MKKSSLFGVAYLLAGRKMKIALVGAQLGYRGYKYLKKKRKRKNNNTV